MSRLQTGALLTDLFSIFFANIVPFVLIAFIALVPWVVVFLTDPARLLTQTLAAMLQFALGQLATAAITLGVYNQLQGKPVSVGACIGVALRRGFRVVLASLLAGFIVGLATLALVIPGLIMAAMLFVAIPVIVVERAGVIEALDRSARLTDGYRWPIFFLMLFFFLLSGIAGFVGSVGVLSVGPLAIFGQLAIQGFVTAMHAVAAALVYYRLRQQKEDLDLEQVAKVFA